MNTKKIIVGGIAVVILLSIFQRGGANQTNNNTSSAGKLNIFVKSDSIVFDNVTYQNIEDLPLKQNTKYKIKFAGNTTVQRESYILNYLNVNSIPHEEVF